MLLLTPLTLGPPPPGLPKSLESLALRSWLPESCALQLVRVLPKFYDGIDTQLPLPEVLMQLTPAEIWVLASECFLCDPNVCVTLWPLREMLSDDRGNEAQAE